jgi:Uma2 family endonuclease
MNDLARKFTTAEEYLEIERAAEFKSEFYAGEMFMMAGAKANHVQIVVNLSRDLSISFKKKPCRVFSTDMRVLTTKSGLYTYPDLVVVCETAKFLDEKKDTLLNPNLIIEVLSDSTESYDRGKKFQMYREIETLQEYVLVSCHQKKIEVFKKVNPKQWLLSEFKMDESVLFESIDSNFSMQEIYEKVEFDADSDRLK